MALVTTSYIDNAEYRVTLGRNTGDGVVWLINDVVAEVQLPITSFPIYLSAETGACAAVIGDTDYRHLPSDTAEGVLNYLQTSASSDKTKAELGYSYVTEGGSTALLNNLARVWVLRSAGLYMLGYIDENEIPHIMNWCANAVELQKNMLEWHIYFNNVMDKYSFNCSSFVFTREVDRADVTLFAPYDTLRSIAETYIQYNFAEGCLFAIYPNDTGYTAAIATTGERTLSDSVVQVTADAEQDGNALSRLFAEQLNAMEEKYAGVHGAWTDVVPQLNKGIAPEDRLEPRIIKHTERPSAYTAYTYDSEPEKLPQLMPQQDERFYSNLLWLANSPATIQLSTRALDFLDRHGDAQRTSDERRLEDKGLFLANDKGDIVALHDYVMLDALLYNYYFGVYLEPKMIKNTSVLMSGNYAGAAYNILKGTYGTTISKETAEAYRRTSTLFKKRGQTLPRANYYGTLDLFSDALVFGLAQRGAIDTRELSRFDHWALIDGGLRGIRLLTDPLGDSNICGTRCGKMRCSKNAEGIRNLREPVKRPGAYYISDIELFTCKYVDDSTLLAHSTDGEVCDYDRCYSYSDEWEAQINSSKLAELYAPLEPLGWGKAYSVRRGAFALADLLTSAGFAPLSIKYVTALRGGSEILSLYFVVINQLVSLFERSFYASLTKAATQNSLYSFSPCLQKNSMRGCGFPVELETQHMLSDGLETDYTRAYNVRFDVNSQNFAPVATRFPFLRKAIEAIQQSDIASGKQMRDKMVIELSRDAMTFASDIDKNKWKWHEYLGSTDVYPSYNNAATTNTLLYFVDRYCDSGEKFRHDLCSKNDELQELLKSISVPHPFHDVRMTYADYFAEVEKEQERNPTEFVTYTGTSVATMCEQAYYYGWDMCSRMNFITAMTKGKDPFYTEYTNAYRVFSKFMEQFVEDLELWSEKPEGAASLYALVAKIQGTMPEYSLPALINALSSVDVDAVLSSVAAEVPTYTDLYAKFCTLRTQYAQKKAEVYEDLGDVPAAMPVQRNADELNAQVQLSYDISKVSAVGSLSGMHTLLPRVQLNQAITELPKEDDVAGASQDWTVILDDELDDTTDTPEDVDAVAQLTNELLDAGVLDKLKASVDEVVDDYIAASEETSPSDNAEETGDIESAPSDNAEETDLAATDDDDSWFNDEQADEDAAADNTVIPTADDDDDWLSAMNTEGLAGFGAEPEEEIDEGLAAMWGESDDNTEPEAEQSNADVAALWGDDTADEEPTEAANADVAALWGDAAEDTNTVVDDTAAENKADIDAPWSDEPDEGTVTEPIAEQEAIDPEVDDGTEAGEIEDDASDEQDEDDACFVTPMPMQTSMPMLFDIHAPVAGLVDSVAPALELDAMPDIDMSTDGLVDTVAPMFGDDTASNINAAEDAVKTENVGGNMGLMNTDLAAVEAANRRAQAVARRRDKAIQTTLLGMDSFLRNGGASNLFKKAEEISKQPKRKKRTSKPAAIEAKAPQQDVPITRDELGEVEIIDPATIRTVTPATYVLYSNAHDLALSQVKAQCYTNLGITGFVLMSRNGAATRYAYVDGTIEAMYKFCEEHKATWYFDEPEFMCVDMMGECYRVHSVLNERSKTRLFAANGDIKKIKKIIMPIPIKKERVVRVK